MSRKPRVEPLSEYEMKALVDDPKLALKIETIADGLFRG